MPKTKLVIFDYDGVLVDSLPLTLQVYERFFTHINHSRRFSKDEFKQLFDCDWRQGLRNMGVHDDGQIELCEKMFFKIMNERSDKVKLYLNMAEVLADLKKKGLLIALISNNRSDIMKKKLRDEGVLQYFDKVYDANDGFKPDPTAINKCLKELNINPEEAVMIGDMDGDMLAAKNAKLKKAIAVSYGYHHQNKLKLADVVIDNPLEIIGVIN